MRYPKEFLPFTVRDWNLLNEIAGAAKPNLSLKERTIIQPKISPCNKIRYITMLRMGLSPLHKHNYTKTIFKTNTNFLLFVAPLKIPNTICCPVNPTYWPESPCFKPYPPFSSPN